MKNDGLVGGPDRIRPHHRTGRPLTASHGGSSSCPIVTGYGRMVRAEFDYDGQPAESFSFDQSKERSSMRLLKTQVLPQLYWHGMLHGRL